ncbi:proline-rich protein PRCC [Bombyx mandarina]|uniref:Proline-rich protein PRCC n=1 Tax=Bombyx mandarina TaxID=7092 RepID=A0A6J2JPF3_BOMMA|nr:proline-rich protein PRCC [Bombyx mandarina]
MALVAYENSDSSDFEDCDTECPAAVISTEKYAASTSTLVHDTTEPCQNLFNLLPEPSHKKPLVVEEDDEFLHKKEKHIVKPKAKISVPSLQDFKDMEDSLPNNKNKIHSGGKKSGLLSILPQPKNGVTLTNKSFIPNILVKNPTTTSIKKKQQTQSSPKKVKKETQSIINDYSDESDSEELGNDFFSINKPVLIAPEVLSVDSELVQNTNTSKGLSSFDSHINNNMNGYETGETDLNVVASTETPVDNSHDLEIPVENHNDFQQPSNSNEDILDDEAILKLVGARGKRKREEIQIVDVNQKEVLGDSREWLLKSLMDDTTRRVSSSKKRGNEPTNQQKRKHQITYLAHQAKANEAELQNQWANNRMSRRQTQSKYGF